MINKKGLTLIELLSVIAIIAILFILLIPQISNAIDKSRVSGVQMDLHSYEIGMRSYLMENFGEEKRVEKLNKYLDKRIQFEQVNNKWIATAEENPYKVKYELTSDWDTYMQVNSYTNEKDPRMHAVRVYEERDVVESMYIGYENEIKKSEFDDEKPVVSLSVNGSETELAEHETIVTVTDNKIVHSIKYAWSTSTTKPITNDFKTIANGSTIKTAKTNGTLYLHIEARDESGNKTEYYSQGFKTGDRIKPTISISPNGNQTYALTNSTTITVTDNEEIAKIEYVWSESEITPLTGWSETTSGTTVTSVETDGNVYLYVRAEDTFGNITNLKSEVFVQMPYTYTIDESGVTITNYLGTRLNIKIPQTIEGKDVIAIGDNALKMKKVESVIFPNTLKKIGSNGLASNPLKTIDIPSSVEYIGESAFSNNRLTELELPEGVKYIGNYAFMSNNITSLKLSNTVEYIGKSAFRLNDLTTVTVPGSVKTIDESAFYYNAITSIELMEGIESIGVYAFSQNDIKTVRIPTSVKELVRISFYDNPNLKTVQNCSNLNVTSHFNSSPTITKDGC